MAHTTPVRILVADDQVDILDAFTLLLSDDGDDAARQLGMSRSALYRRLQHYGVRE